MTETFTQSRAEDAIAQTSAFMEAERGATIDGAYAADQVAQRVQTAAERAAALLRAVPLPNQPGFYVPLSKFNAANYGEAVHTLPGHVVLVPSKLVEHGSPAFYPAVISEDGPKQTRYACTCYTNLTEPNAAWAMGRRLCFQLPVSPRLQVLESTERGPVTA